MLVYWFYALYLWAPRAILVNSVSLGIAALSWFVQEKLHRERLSAHLLLFAGLFVLFGAALGDGNLKGSGFWHLPLLSLGAGFVLGTRAAVAWAVAGALAIALQSYLHFNVEFVRDYPATWENVLAMRIFGVVVAATFGHLSSKTTRERVRIKRLKMREIQQATLNAELANEAKSKFLAQVSHELRTPMNGILGMTQFLQQRASLAPEAREHVQTIHRCSNSLLDLFREILDLSRVEASDWNIQHQPIDLVSVVRGVGELFGAQANNDRRTLRVNIDLESFWFWGDGIRLSQVLSNLVGNAVKFCESGLIEIDVKVRPDEQGLDSASHQVEILVRDEGVGMTESQERAVFSEFIQAKSKNSGSVPEGTGLGLVISREIMQKMGGSLEVSSALDEGTEFTVSFGVKACAAPRAQAQAVAEQEPAVLQQEEPLRVLVVDDLAINRRVASLSLKRLGCEVDEAEDGEIAVQMADKRAYDCIFMDLRMPKKDGYDATAQILAESTCNRATPVVALSASAFDEDRARCFDVGMVAHVAKPFRSSDLQAVLKEHVIEGQRCTQSGVVEVLRAA